MWFCEGKSCCERFATKREIEDRIDVTHPKRDHLSHIDERFRVFKVLNLEAERSQYLKSFHIRDPAVQNNTHGL